jgi:hypothetical protein
MSFFNWLRGTTRRRAKVRCQPPPRCRLLVEGLEDRTVPANYSAASVPELIVAIEAANLTTEADTITLAAGKTFTLTQVNNFTHGPTGLPTIAAAEELTIVGNGATIERSTAKGTPAFRLIDVAAGASLTLQNLTLQRGLAVRTREGISNQGGAIINQGTLALSGVTVQNNTSQGDDRSEAAGGGIWSSGSLSVEHSTIQNNQALGSPSGSARGGGLYVDGGSASLIDVTLYSNTARGGDGSDRVKVYVESGPKHTSFYYLPATSGGSAFGGALYISGGTLSLQNSTVTRNVAKGGIGGNDPNTRTFDGAGQGGGLYLAAAASVSLDAFTFANVKNNSPDDIFGSYTVG